MAAASGGRNGSAVQAALERARAAPLAAGDPPPLIIPPGAAHRCRFPHLELFAARGHLAPAKAGQRPEMSAWEIRLGVRIGLSTGRELKLTLAPGMHARELAQLLRATADSLDAWSEACEAEGTDPRNHADPAAQEGPAALAVDQVRRCVLGAFARARRALAVVRDKLKRRPA